MLALEKIGRSCFCQVLYVLVTQAMFWQQLAYLNKSIAGVDQSPLGDESLDCQSVGLAET